MPAPSASTPGLQTIVSVAVVGAPNTASATTAAPRATSSGSLQAAAPGLQVDKAVFGSAMIALAAAMTVMGML